MSRAEDRRAALLDRLADHVLAHGLSAASLRPLARAAGTSDRMLLYYFPDKDALIAAILETVAARMVALLEAGRTPAPLPVSDLRAALMRTVFADNLWPFMRLWLEIAARAAHGDVALRMTGERIGRGFLAWAAAQLDCPDDAIRTMEAARLLRDVEGALVLRSLGLTDVAEAAG